MGVLGYIGGVVGRYLIRVMSSSFLGVCVMSKSVRPKFPGVVAYHAEVRIQRGDDVLTLCVDRPDWAPDDEVLREAAREAGVETIGDLVAVLESEGRVRVEPK